MQTKTQPLEAIVDVIPTNLESLRVLGPFDKALEKLIRRGHGLISAPEDAYLRIQQGVNSRISGIGNFTIEGISSIPGKGVLLTPKSPIMQDPVRATQAHRDGTEYFLNDKQVEWVLSQEYIRLSRKSIPTDRFSEEEITDRLFGYVAKLYGLFLHEEVGIKEVYVSVNDSKDLNGKPFARQMFLAALDKTCLGGSLRASCRSLDQDHMLRGVRVINQHRALNKSYALRGVRVIN